MQPLPCPSCLQDVSFLDNATYTQLMAAWLHEAEEVEASQAGALCSVQQPDDTSSRDLVVAYKDINHYKQLAKQLAPMLSDVQSNPPMPRAAYRGVVTVRCKGRRLFIRPA